MSLPLQLCGLNQLILGPEVLNPGHTLKSHGNLKKMNWVVPTQNQLYKNLGGRMCRVIQARIFLKLLGYFIKTLFFILMQL